MGFRGMLAVPVCPVCHSIMGRRLHWRGGEAQAVGHSLRYSKVHSKGPGEPPDDPSICAPWNYRLQLDLGRLHVHHTDGKQDWARETAKMSTVYRNGLVTIIASSAACCDEGFLDKVRKMSVLLGVYDWGHHRGGPQSHDCHYNKWLNPVDFRGWTLQERVLSTRLLCFASDEVQFSYHESRACECGQQLMGDMYTAREPEEQWFSTVREYSRRSLTKQSDVTVAFKGIQHAAAAKVQEATCVSMIWLQPTMTPFTARSLLWYRYGYEEVAAYFPKDLAVPSYSWTSLKGEFVHSSSSQFQGAKFPTKCLGFDAEDIKSKDLDGTSIRLLGMESVNWYKENHAAGTNYPDKQTDPVSQHRL
ncbi:hypothetical protein PG994_003665 [Apiospora phragmitis]|uniref:Heterokaryon incompatibility protein n=1 Tax=Apiospora phragmitis TaxID=2905665 RepID=A0ABR1VYV1_9PEZI